VATLFGSLLAFGNNAIRGRGGVGGQEEGPQCGVQPEAESGDVVGVVRGRGQYR
jgi:hypothetical protein